MGYKFGSRSLGRLNGLHGDLQKLLHEAIATSPLDFTVVEGLRTRATQAGYYAQGRTKPGKIITWTLNSRHITGHAVDIAPCNAKGEIDWDDKAAFNRLAAHMFAVSKRLNIPIRWGADWNGNGKAWEKGEYDGPHFELHAATYP